jgi:outer membrane protein assembly factor BamB
VLYLRLTPNLRASLPPGRPVPARLPPQLRNRPEPRHQLLAYGQETALVGVGQTLIAISATTGKDRWQRTLDGGVAQITVDGTIAYVTTARRTGGGLYAIQL